jgi:hypothetical protein
MPDTASRNGRWTRLLAPGGRYYLLALALFVVVFAIIPFSIYAHSGEDWGFPFSELLSVSALGLALFLVCAVLIRLVARLRPGAASTAAVTLFCLGVFLLLAHVYAPIQVEPLDGTGIESAEPTLYSIIELAFLVALVPVFVQLRRGRGLSVAAAFSVALVVVALGYAGALSGADRGEPAIVEAQSEPAAPMPTTGSSAIEGNVYQIVLDRMQTDAFLHAVKQTGRAEDFQGFELFRKNISNYISTIPSSASYFTGTLYKGGEFKDWGGAWQKGRGLLATLSDSGYQTWMYSAMRSWNNKYIDQYQYAVDIYEQESGFANAGMYDLLQIWLASLAPNPLTNEAMPLAATLADPIFELATGRMRPLSGLEGLHQVAGALLLRRLVGEETLRAPDGVYVYAHAELPHGPHVLDRDCRYVGRPGQRAEPLSPTAGYLLQAECAVDLVGSFLQELRRLDRYQNATIVIHGDTGDWMPLGKTKRRGKILDYSQASLLSYVQALLMIKRPHAEGPLQALDTPTQLVDLFPTVVDVLDLPPPDEIDGESVYSIREGERRDVRIGFDPEDLTNGRNFVEVRIEDQMDLQNSELTVLGPATDPATWSPQVGDKAIEDKPR